MSWDAQSLLKISPSVVLERRLKINVKCTCVRACVRACVCDRPYKFNVPSNGIGDQWRCVGQLGRDRVGTKNTLTELKQAREKLEKRRSSNKNWGGSTGSKIWSNLQCLRLQKPVVCKFGRLESGQTWVELKKLLPDECLIHSGGLTVFHVIWGVPETELNQSPTNTPLLNDRYCKGCSLLLLLYWLPKTGENLASLV